MTFYAHYRDVKEWRYANFTPSEIACRGTGKLLVDKDALDRLQALRNLLGKPIIVNSAYRSPEHNRAIKNAAPNSLHLQGRAFDVSMVNHDPEVFEVAARKVGFTGFGFYPRKQMMHIDTGPVRTWGTRFAKPEFGVEKHVPEKPSQDPIARAVTGGGLAAGVSTAAGVVREVSDTFSYAPVVAGVVAMIVLAIGAYYVYKQYQD